MGWALGALHASDGQVQCSVVVRWTAEHTSKMDGEKIYTGTLAGGGQIELSIWCRRSLPCSMHQEVGPPSESYCHCMELEFRVLSGGTYLSLIQEELGSGGRISPGGPHHIQLSSIRARRYCANASWIGGKQLGYDGLLLHQLRSCLGEWFGRQWPGIRSRLPSRMGNPLARLGLSPMRFPCSWRALGPSSTPGPRRQ